MDCCSLDFSLELWSDIVTFSRTTPNEVRIPPCLQHKSNRGRILYGRVGPNRGPPAGNVHDILRTKAGVTQPLPGMDQEF